MDYKRLALNLVFFWLGILIPLLAFQSAFAEDPCSFTSYTSYSSDLTELVESSTATYYGSWSSASFSCTKDGTYYVNSDTRVTQYDVWGAGEDFCAANPTATVSSIYGRRRVIDFMNGCVLPVPSECGNGQLDVGEEGIDCGGICPDTCGEPECPGGYIAILDGSTITGCAREGAQDSFGNCGAGFFYVADIGKCVSLDQVTDPISYGDSYTPPELDPVDPFTPGTFSVTHFASAESVVDNQDGTETATISITSIDDDGRETSTTASVTRPLGSEAGTGFETGTDPDIPLAIAPGYEGQTEYQEDTDPEDDPGNYDYQLDVGEYDGDLSDEDLPDKNSLTDLFNSFISNNPVVSTITGSGIDLQDSVTELTWVYPPTGQLVTFDLSDRNDVLSTIGILLVFLSGISAYYIIVGRQ